MITLSLLLTWRQCTTPLCLLGLGHKNILSGFTLTLKALSFGWKSVHATEVQLTMQSNEQEKGQGGGWGGGGKESAFSKNICCTLYKGEGFCTVSKGWLLRASFLWHLPSLPKVHGAAVERPTALCCTGQASAAAMSLLSPACCLLLRGANRARAFWTYFKKHFKLVGSFVLVMAWFPALLIFFSHLLQLSSS